MFNFFKKKLTKPAPQTRALTHASELMVGDMFTLIDSFAYPNWLKGETLKVTAVQTYQYEYEAEYEFVLETNSGKVAFLQIEQEDGEQWANFSIKIQRDDVDAIFSLEQFARIFDEEALTELSTQNTPDAFSHFLAKRYKQSEAPYVAYFHNKDFRGKSLPRYAEQGGEPCEVIELCSDDEQHSINIEVWEGGETEISLTLTRPLSDIIDLFPGNT